MDEDFSNRWFRGIVVPCAAVVWGIKSLRSGEIVLPIRRFESLPIYSYIHVHAWPATLIAVALISYGSHMHFGLLWSQFPTVERPASLVAVCTAWIGRILFAIGIFSWSIGAVAGFWQ